MSSNTPGLPTPPRPCLTCTKPTRNQGQRCDTCQTKKRRTHNQHHAYYSSKEWRALREQCRAASYHQCCVCTSTKRLMAHHIIPRRDGGADALYNLACLCMRCHSRLEAGDDRTAALLREYIRIRPAQ